jgi:hypothetical protein
MLKKRIIALDRCYANNKHSPGLLKKYEHACFEIFEKIANLEKTNSLKKNLKGSVKLMTFEN